MSKLILVKPILKWTDKKAQLLKEIKKRYPDTITKYCEPFVGGGTVLFDILSKYKPASVMINDTNEALICVYEQVKNNIDPLIHLLKNYENNYKADGITEDDRFVIYSDIKARFNKRKKDGIFDTETAAMLIFLNKTCCNGLYQVNSIGAFNVPKSNAVNPTICDEENLRNASELLQSVTINCGNYTECESFIDNNTFVYLDPPSRDTQKSKSFTKYVPDRFDDEEHTNLKEFITTIHNKNAKFIMSNTDPKNVDEDDEFFDELYEGFNIDRISATRKSDKNELLICNFKKKPNLTKKAIAPCEVIDFIEKFKFAFKSEIEHIFTQGNCYYFAIILKERFGADIYYLPIDNHFIAKIDSFFYDIKGIVIPNEVPVKWSDYEDIEPTGAERTVRDCIKFETR